MAPLQKRAWLALGVGVLMSLAIIGIFVAKGATSYDDDKGMRVIVSVLFVATLALYAVIMSLTRRGRGQTGVFRDERDEAIVKSASVVQLWAVVVSLVAWVIALSEVYWDQGVMPVVFLYLIFMSTLIVNMLAQAVGILIGYRRAGAHGEG